MAAVSSRPSLKGMDSHARSSTSHDSVETEGFGSTGGNAGGRVEIVSDLMFFGSRSSSVQPLEEAKDVRYFCSDVDDAAVVPKGGYQDTSSVSVLKDSSYMEKSSRSRGRRLYRSSFFGSFSASVFVVLIGVVLCSSSVLGSDARPDCFELPNTDIKNLTTCINSYLTIKAINKAYPIADFSKYSQDQMNAVLTSRDRYGDLEAGKIKQFAGNFLMKGSKVVKTLQFDFFVDKARKDITQSCILENNLVLENVTIGLEKKNVADFLIKFTVSGNRRLSTETIAHLQNISFKSDDSYIQNFGGMRYLNIVDTWLTECVFDSELGNLDDLEDCHYIRGDLKIGLNTDTTPQTVEKLLSKITGSLEVKGSKFKNLDFMASIGSIGKTEITDNKELCLHPEELHDLKKKRPGVLYKDNKECKGECTNTYFMTEKDTTCVIIKGTVTITGVSDEDDISHFSVVEKIIGQLIISDTALSSIDMFPSLHTVDFSTGSSASTVIPYFPSAGGDKYQPAIFVKRNMKLSFFSFPNLTEVKLIDGAVAEGIALEDNNATFYMEDEDLWKYGNITTTRLPKKAPSTIVVVVENGQNETKPAKTTKGGQEESSNTVAIAVSSAVGVGLLIGLIIAIVIFLAMSWKNIKKRRKQKNILKNTAGRMIAQMKNTKSGVKKKSGGGGCASGAPEEQPKSLRSDADSEKTEDRDEWNAYKLFGHVRDLMEGIKEYSMEYQRTSFKNDCVQIANNKKEIKINRSVPKMEVFQEWRKIKGIDEKMDAGVKKIFGHNLDIKPFVIHPRRENTEVLVYNQEGETFDPMAFIEAVMSSSAVELSAKTMHAALDYALDHPFGAHSKDDPKESQLILVEGPVHIIGDTHGSLIDLQALLSIESPNASCEFGDTKVHPMFRYKYLFLGDYLDRGIYDVVCLVFLAVLAKIRKDKIFLLRGNHDWIYEAGLGAKYTHYAHIHQLYGQEQFELDPGTIRTKVQKLRNKLPICAIVEGKMFACHGGINERLVKICEEPGVKEKGIRALFEKIPFPLFSCPTNEMSQEKIDEILEGMSGAEQVLEVVRLVQSVLWPDPFPLAYYSCSRKCGGSFSEDTVDRFCKVWNLQLLVRAHEDIGFGWEHGGKTITLFGNHATEASKIGFPYLFYNQQGFDSYLLNIKPLGMLRLEKNGTLTMLMLFNVYEENEKTIVQPVGVNAGKDNWAPMYSEEEYYNGIYGKYDIFEKLHKMEQKDEPIEEAPVDEEPGVGGQGNDVYEPEGFNVPPAALPGGEGNGDLFEQQENPPKSVHKDAPKEQVPDPKTKAPTTKPEAPKAKPATTESTPQTNQNPTAAPEARKPEAQQQPLKAKPTTTGTTPQTNQKPATPQSKVGTPEVLKAKPATTQSTPETKPKPATPETRKPEAQPPKAKPPQSKPEAPFPQAEPPKQSKEETHKTKTSQEKEAGKAKSKVEAPVSKTEPPKPNPKSMAQKPQSKAEAPKSKSGTSNIDAGKSKVKAPQSKVDRPKSKGSSSGAAPPTKQSKQSTMTNGVAPRTVKSTVPSKSGAPNNKSSHKK